MVLKITASLYIFSTIFLSHYSWGTKYNKIMAVSLLAVVIVERLWNKKRLLEISPQHILFILWCMLGTFAGLISSSGEDVFKTTVRVSLVFLAAIPLYMIIVDRICLKWMSWTLVISAIASSAIINFGILPPPPGLSPRFVGTLGNANRFAFVSLMGIVSLTYLWRVQNQSLVKLLILFAGGLISYQIILSGSRKGFIGVFLIFFLQYVFYVFNNRKKEFFKRLIGGLVVLSISLGIFGYFIMTSDFSYRMRNVMLYLKGEKLEKGERSLFKRAHFIEVGYKNFLESPIIGTGLSSFDETEIGYSIFSKKIGSYSHSNFIEVLVSSGTIGFILYYSIYWSCTLRLLHQFKVELNNSIKPILYFAATGIVVLIFYEFFAVTYYGKEFWIFLSCILAFMRTLNRKTLLLNSSEVISD